MNLLLLSLCSLRQKEGPARRRRGPHWACPAGGGSWGSRCKTLCFIEEEEERHVRVLSWLENEGRVIYVLSQPREERAQGENFSSFSSLQRKLQQLQLECGAWARLPSFSATAELQRDSGLEVMLVLTNDAEKKLETMRLIPVRDSAVHVHARRVCRNAAFLHVIERESEKNLFSLSAMT